MALNSLSLPPPSEYLRFEALEDFWREVGEEGEEPEEEGEEEEEEEEEEERDTVGANDLGVLKVAVGSPDALAICCRVCSRAKEERGGLGIGEGVVEGRPEGQEA